MYANVAQIPMFAGRDSNPFIFNGLTLEQAQPLFAGLTLEPAQPLFAGVDRNGIVNLAGADRGEIISLKGRRGFGEIGGGTVALGAGALILSAVLSFGLMTLASYTGARLAGCRR